MVNICRAIEAQVKASKHPYVVTYDRTIKNNTKIKLYPTRNAQTSGKGEEASYFDLQAVKSTLHNVTIGGVKGCDRAVIAKNEKTGKLELQISGTGLKEVMTIDGVKGTATHTNSVMEVKDTLGIEAARAKILTEIDNVISSYGMQIDVRHMQCLADTMTSMGDVVGINRFGIQKLKASTLMLASFERTNDHLFDA